MPTIYLIPTPIGQGIDQINPQTNGILENIDYLVVENLRSARRFIATLKLVKKIDDFTFQELNEHTPPEDIQMILQPIIDGKNGAIISEAGLPCVADPGAPLVALAHQYNIKIKPLVGPNSIMLALMASGASGQSFAFNGYIPIKELDRNKTIKNLETKAKFQTQILIETPYRNNSLLKSLSNILQPNTFVTVALGLCTEHESIVRKTAQKWKATQTELPKEPAVFIIG